MVRDAAADGKGQRAPHHSAAADERWNLELWVRVVLWHAADGAEPLARCA